LSNCQSPACPGSTRKSSPVIRHFRLPRLFFISLPSDAGAGQRGEPIAGMVLDVIIESSEACACLCFLPLGADLRVRRGVAQPGRAPGSGPGGRRFKSSLPDQSFQSVIENSPELFFGPAAENRTPNPRAAQFLEIIRDCGDDSKDQHSRKECGERLELPWSDRIPKSSLLTQPGDVFSRRTAEEAAVFSAEL
jgi:hypothetical protein